MSTVGYNAKNLPRQVARRGVRDDIDDRATPPDLFDRLNQRFAFTVDVAANATNAKCPRFYDRFLDGLAQPWAGERVWCNPPFSDIRPWVERALVGDAAVVVMLVPANRTEQRWWQDLIEPIRDREGSPLRVEFISGRTRFLTPDGKNVRRKAQGGCCPPFGCCLLIFGRTQ